MATVAFPSGFNLDRSSNFKAKNPVKTDFMSDGSPRQRTVGTTKYTTVPCKFSSLYAAEKGTLVAFLDENAANTITWTVDGVSYSGVIVDGDHEFTMSGILFNITFQYYCRAV